ncbi:MAG: phage late control D family protein [Prochloraceae cyanobacterium]
MFDNNSLSEQYQSNLTIKIDGQEISENLKEDILQVIVEESMYVPSMCVIAFQNELASGATKDRQWRHQDTMKIGKELSVSFKSVTTEVFGGESNYKEVFKGRVVAVQVPFSKKAQAPIILRAYDNSYPLHLGSRTRSFLNKTDSEIVKDIVSEAGLKIGEIQETEKTDRAESPNQERYVCQANMTDMEFLLLLARRNGFEFFIREDKVYFRSPNDRESIDMTWLSGRGDGGSQRAKNIIDDITVSQTAGGQVPQIEVRAWDYKNKQLISSLSNKQKNVVTNLPNNINPEGDRVAAKLGGNSSERVLSIVDFPVNSIEEAENLAQAFCDEIRGQYVQGDAECEGNPEIWPGKAVVLDDNNSSNNNNMGGYKGKYYVTQTRHIFQPGRERVYTTEF